MNSELANQSTSAPTGRESLAQGAALGVKSRGSKHKPQWRRIIARILLILAALAVLWTGYEVLRRQRGYSKASELAQFKTMYANPLWVMAFTFLEPFPVGLLVTVVTALTLRRKGTA